MKKLGLVLLILGLTFACSNRKEVTDATINFNLGANYAGNSALYTGGKKFYGHSDNGDSFGMDIQSGSFEKKLRNGTWSFFAIIWDGANFSGTVRCAFQNGVVLGGGDVDLSLNLNNADCGNTGIFGPSHIPASDYEFHAIEISGVRDGVNAIAHDLCTRDGGASAACASNSAKINGSYTAYAISIPNFEIHDDNVVSVQPALSSNSYTFCRPASGGTSGVTDAFPVNIPAHLPVRVYAAQQGNCTSFPTNFGDLRGSKELSLLKGGFLGAVSPVNTYANGGNDTLRVYHVNNSSSICSGKLDAVNAHIFAAGDGGNHPYAICSADQFNKIGNSHSSNNFVLSNNINFDDTSNDKNLVCSGVFYPMVNFVPIGADPAAGGMCDGMDASTDYTGKFDGRNFKLENLRMNDDSISGDDLGTFRSLGSGAVVENLVIKMPEFNSSMNKLGGLVGVIYGTSTISNIEINEADIRGDDNGSDYIGILIGKSISSPNISNIRIFDSEVEGQDYVGGLNSLTLWEYFFLLAL